MADSVDVHIEDDAQLRREFMYAGFGGLPEGTHVYRIDGPFFFAAIERFRESLADEQARVLILRLDNVPFADATALHALEEAVIALQARGGRVMLTGANQRVTSKLARMGLRERLGPGNLQPELMQALRALQVETPSPSPAS